MSAEKSREEKITELLAMNKFTDEEIADMMGADPLDVSRIKTRKGDEKSIKMSKPIKINETLLIECPDLSDYEKDILKRFYIDKETNKSIAEDYNKTPGTVSTQKKRALEKYEEWKETESYKDVEPQKVEFKTDLKA